jgi:hypothetical protein
VGIVEDVGEAAERVATALTASGFRADFTPRSLWEIERFFESEVSNGRPRPNGLLAQQTGQRLFALGSYVGEVVRRGAGGAWIGDDEDPAAEINVALDLPDGSRIWPIQRVMKRFSNGAQDSVIAYGAALGLDIGERLDKPRRRWFQIRMR